MPKSDHSPAPPEGLVYRPELVSAEAERSLLEFLDGIEFRQVVMRRQAAKRTVRHYGWDYEYETWKLFRAEPLPAPFEPARLAAAELAGVEPDELAQILVTRYPAGAPIGWHRDAPMFGRVVGVSLASACRMRFQRGSGENRRVWEVELEPRSAYVLRGAARWAWQHSIPPTKADRYSVTFRTLRTRDR